MILEKWMIRNLKKYGNCSVHPDFFKAHNEESVIEYLKELGFEHVRIEHKEESEFSLKTAIIHTKPETFETKIKKKSLN